MRPSELVCGPLYKTDVEVTKTDEPNNDVNRKRISNRDEIARPRIVSTAPAPRQVANTFAKNCLGRKGRKRRTPHSASDVNEIPRLHFPGEQNECIEQTAKKHR